MNETEPVRTSCHICNGWGSHPTINGAGTERHRERIPCFVCEGTGNPTSQPFQHFANAQVLDSGKISIHPDTFCVKRKLSIEIDWHFEAQQDGHIPTKLWEDTQKAIQIGKQVLKAIEQYGATEGWKS